MIHDNPDFKFDLRQALSDVENGPTVETLVAAPLLDHWFGVSQNAFPRLCGQISLAETLAQSNGVWSKTCIVLGLDKDCRWVRAQDRFYRLSSAPYRSLPDFEQNFGKLALQNLQPVSLDEFKRLVDAFAGRANWYLGQIS